MSLKNETKLLEMSWNSVVCYTYPPKPSMSLVKKLCNSEEYGKMFSFEDVKQLSDFQAK